MATINGAVAMAAAATVNISETPLIPGPTTVPGSSTIPGTRVYVTTAGAVVLSGSAALATASTYVGKPQAALTATSTLPTAGQATYQVQDTLAATSTLTAASQATFFLAAGAAPLAGASTLLEIVRTTMPVAMTFAGGTTLAANALSRQPVSAPTLTGAAALTLGDPLATRLGSAFGATSTLSSAASAYALATVTFAPETFLAAAGKMTGISGASLVGGSTFALALGQSGASVVALSATTTLTLGPLRIAVETALLTGSSALGPQAWTIQQVTVTLAGASGGFISTLVTLWLGAAALSASAGMGPVFGDRVKVAVAYMFGLAELTATATTRPLIPPDFVPRSIAPITVVPKWHLYVADTRTGKVAYELPVITQQWSSKLDDIGTATATINIDQAHDSISDWHDERDPRTLFREFLSGPMRYSGVFAYGNQAVWAGPLGPVSASSSTPEVQIGFSEFPYLLTRRLLLGSRTAPTSAAGDLYFGPTTRQQIALELVKAGTTNLGGAFTLPWQLAASLPTGGDNTIVRRYYGSDFQTVWDALSALSQESDGPDIRFDPVLTYASDGLYLSYNLNIGTPLVYNATTWAWDVPATAAISWDTNVQNFGTRYWGIGAGQDELKLAAQATNPTLLGLGFPELELSDTLHSSVDDPFQLQSLVTADMLLYEQPAIKWTLSVQGSREPMLGSFRVGDRFLVTVQGHPAIPDGTFQRRITTVDGDTSEWASIGSADAYVVQTTTQEGVQIITSQ